MTAVSGLTHSGRSENSGAPPRHDVTMARRRRIDLPELTHHVVNRGVDRNPIFLDDRDRSRFGLILGSAHDRFGVTLQAYCLMDNHYHLMIHCPEAVLSESMQFIGSEYAGWFNAVHGRVGHLFGARFWSAPLSTDTYRLGTLRYIERNSLDIDGVKSPDAYRWSSVRAHLGLRNGPEWLDTKTVLSWFHSVDGYAQFVGRDVEAVEPQRIDVRLVENVASLMIDSHVSDDVSPIRLARTIQVGLSLRLGITNQRLLLEHLGLDSRGQVRKAWRRFEERAELHPSVNKAVDSLQLWLFDTGDAARDHAA